MRGAEHLGDGVAVEVLRVLVEDQGLAPGLALRQPNREADSAGPGVSELSPHARVVLINRFLNKL
eukprot:14676925-Heterocapsa_arctica.AAC.1